MAALLNIGNAAYYIVQSPLNQSDFTEVRYWLDHWTQSAANPYTRADALVDYPPQAFISLQWISWGSLPLMMWLFPLINLAAACLACWQAALWASELTGRRLTTPSLVALVCLLLSTRSVRSSLIIGQTAPLAFFAGFVALRLAARAPRLAGLCLAAASFKLYLAAGLGLVLLRLRRFQALVAGAAITAAMILMFALRTGVSFFEVLGDYLAVLTRGYAGEGAIYGVTGVRRVLVAALPVFPLIDILYVVTALALLAGVWWLTSAERVGAARGPWAVLLCLLWSMLSLPYNRYSTLLLVVVLWCVWTLLDRHETERLWLRVVMSVALLSFLPPARLLIGLAIGEPYLAATLANNTHRVVSFGVSAVVVWVLLSGRGLAYTERGNFSGSGARG